MWFAKWSFGCILSDYYRLKLHAYPNVLLRMIFVGFPSLAYMSNVISQWNVFNRMFIFYHTKNFWKIGTISLYLCKYNKNTFKNVSIKLIKLHNEHIYVIRFNIILGVIYVFPLLHKNIKFSFFERYSNIFIYFS
jgi:hypothetical protein